MRKQARYAVPDVSRDRLTSTNELAATTRPGIAGLHNPVGTIIAKRNQVAGKIATVYG